MSQKLGAEHEGRGEGYGRYKGLTIGEIQALFDGCIADPSFRSISAVLRITREQLDARGNLGIYPWFAVVAAMVCIGSVAARSVLSGDYLEWATKTAIGSGCALILLLITTVPTWRTRRGNVAQERAICRAAREALEKILDFEPVLKPLTIEQETTVRILLKRGEAGDSLRRMLD